MDGRREGGLRLLLGIGAVVSVVIGVWGVVWTAMLETVLGADTGRGAAGLGRLFGAVMLAVGVAYALAAARPRHSRALLVPLLFVPLALGVATVANVARGEVRHTVRAGAWAAYNLAYCLVFFRLYPRVEGGEASAPST